MYTIKNLDKLREIPQFMREGPFKKILEMAEIKNMTKEQYAEYEESLRRRWDEQGIKEGAFDRGKEQGIEQGIEQGFELGRKKEQEIAEKKQIETIKKFLKIGTSAPDIANSFDIDIALVLEIQKLMGE